MHLCKGSQGTHNIAGKVYEKNPQTLSEVIRLVEKLNTAQEVTATLSPPMVNVMCNDDNCYVCRKKGHIGHHCPQAQCYNCDDFRQFALNCPENIAPSGTPHNHNRSHSHSCSYHSCKDRSHSFHHRYSQGSSFDRSRSHRQPQYDRSSSHHIHPTPYLAMEAILVSPIQIDTLEDTPTGMPHCETGAMHLVIMLESLMTLLHVLPG